MAESEVAKMRRLIDEEYEAALNGLTGVAIIARHEFINHRMERLGQLHGDLSHHIGSVAALEVIMQVNDRMADLINPKPS
jgi:hypothetical protein